MGRALDHLLVDGAHLRLAGFILHQLLKCALLITRRLISTKRLIRRKLLSNIQLSESLNMSSEVVALDS